MVALEGIGYMSEWIEWFDSGAPLWRGVFSWSCSAHGQWLVPAHPLCDIVDLAAERKSRERGPGTPIAAPAC